MYPEQTTTKEIHSSCLGKLDGINRRIPHSLPCREIYKLQAPMIERVFADTKERHGMRYTQLRGL